MNVTCFKSEEAVLSTASPTCQRLFRTHRVKTYLLIVFSLCPILRQALFGIDYFCFYC